MPGEKPMDAQDQAMRSGRVASTEELEYWATQPARYGYELFDGSRALATDPEKIKQLTDSIVDLNSLQVLLGKLNGDNKKQHEIAQHFLARVNRIQPKWWKFKLKESIQTLKDDIDKIKRPLP